MVSVVPSRYPAVVFAGLLILSICLTAVIAGGIITLTQPPSSGTTAEAAPTIETEFDAQRGVVTLAVTSETPINASQLSIQQQSSEGLQQSLLKGTNTTTQSIAALAQTNATTRSQTGAITSSERIQLHLAKRSFTSADSLQILYQSNKTKQLVTTFQFVRFRNT